MTDFPEKWSEDATRRGKAIFDLLETVAAEGQRCPSSSEIAMATGCINDANVTRLMRDLAMVGMIEVTITGGNWRTVTILKGPHAGKRTADHPEASTLAKHSSAEAADTGNVIAAISEAIRHVMGVGATDMRDKAQLSEAVQARQIACWLGYRHFRIPATHLGRHLRRDHTTIIQAANCANEVATNDPIFRDMLLKVGQRAAETLGKPPPEFMGNRNPIAVDSISVDDRIINVIRSCAERGTSLPPIRDFGLLVKSGHGNVRIMLRRMISDGKIRLESVSNTYWIALGDGARARVTQATLKIQPEKAKPEQKREAESSAPTSPMAAPEIAVIRRMQADARPLPPARTCQWLEGEPRHRQFCGAVSLPGSSYCAEHHPRCWSKAERKPSDAGLRNHHAERAAGF